MGFFNKPFYFIVGGIVGHLGGSSYFMYNFLFKKDYLRSINYDPFGVIAGSSIIGATIVYSIAYFTRSIKDIDNQE